MAFALPIEPGAVATNLMDTITDEDILGKLSEMQKMTVLEPEDIAIYYALTQPSRVNINDVYIMPQTAVVTLSFS
jgi:NADP-dependent 3-hydroxy acid dehydrogenase YdfG